MNGELTKTETINQLVRAICVIMLVGVFSFSFAWMVMRGEVKLSAGEFIGVLSVAMTWWFATQRNVMSRAGDSSKTEVKPQGGA